MEWSWKKKEETHSQEEQKPTEETKVEEQS